jgi:hypothetical protein
MGSLFGTVLKFIGTVIMVLAVVVGILVIVIMMDPIERQHHSFGLNVVIFSIMVGLPFLLGYGLDHIGKRLQAGKKVGIVWDPDEYKKYPSPPAAAPSHFVQRPEVVDVEPELPESLVAANSEPALPDPPAAQGLYPAKKARKPDPTAMGVDELHDPDK